MPAIDSIVARLAALHPKRIDLSLERIERLLAALGNPQRRLPPAIHVAGTNGKGSTIAFMRAALEAAGTRETPNSVKRLPNAKLKTAARRSQCSKWRPPQRSCFSPAIRPI